MLGGIVFYVMVDIDMYYWNGKFIGIEYSLAGAPPCPDTYGLATGAHPEYCDKFYKCENGTLTLETCENGLMYDGKGAVHNHCNYNWAVNCDKRLADSKLWFRCILYNDFYELHAKLLFLLF